MNSVKIFILSLPIVLSSCINEPTEKSLVIKTGTSFGFCVGYCSQEATITNNNVEYTSSSWDTSEYPTINSNQSINKNEWKNLIDILNMDEFEKLDDVIGCPDCADGGSEWIEIIQEDRTKKVTFEYGDSLNGNNELLEQLRLIRNRYNENTNTLFRYLNSFESSHDNIGWFGLSEQMIKNEPSPNGGDNSLYIGGGCLQPAASFEINDLPPGYYHISFCSKIESQNQSGTINISNNSQHDALSITINNTDWAKYELGPILTNKNSSLKIEFFVGGIVPAFMFFDNLEIFQLQ